MTHNERQHIKSETYEIMNGVKAAERLLSRLWEDHFYTGLPRSIDADEAEEIDDLFRVILDELSSSTQDYDELTVGYGADAMKVLADCAESRYVAAQAEELYDKARLLILERKNNMNLMRRYDEIGGMEDADAIPALTALIKEIEGAA